MPEGDCQSRIFAPEDGAKFTVWDYLVFGAILAISAGIGIYHACAGGKQRTTREFLLANRSMSAVPVALSVLASFFSASTLLGTPAEIYLEGTMYWMAIIGAVMAPVVGATVFGPFFFKLKVVSVFEYLEARFSSASLRVLAALLFIIRTTIGMGIVLFGPSVALEAVTGFPTWAGIVVVGGVCVFYTSLGGLKAVIWTDVFQTVIMLAGMLAVLIKGSMEVGGIREAFQIANDSGRLNFFDFDPDPTVRHTFWTLLIGNFFVWLYPYTVDQQMVQRFSSTQSLRQAKIALLLNVPGMFIMITLCCLCGLIIYAYYATCDPILRGVIHNPNQLAPRFVVDILGFAPGMPGLFVASLFSGALSSVSSMLNSLAAVTWVDFCKKFTKGQNVSDETAAKITKVFAVLYGAAGIGMAFLFANIGGTVLQMSLAFNGSIGAPLVGIFILGCFFPWCNWIGAFVGAICGFVVPLWFTIGAYITKPPALNNYPRSIEGCSTILITHNCSTLTTHAPDHSSWHTTATTDTDITGINALYTLSYLWYPVLGTLTTIFVGLITSLISGCTHPRDIDPKYIMSYARTFWPCCPQTCHEKCNCGITYKDDSELHGPKNGVSLQDKKSGHCPEDDHREILL